MATSFDSVNTVFYNFIEEDDSFFDYYGLSRIDSIALAQQRADVCLVEAAVKLSLEIQADIDFTDYDYEQRTFAADLTREEKYLLARLQYEAYLSRDVSKLRANAMRFTSAEQTVFSPANDRKTFMAMYTQVCDENQALIDKYVAKDRLSGAPKELTYETEE